MSIAYIDISDFRIRLGDGLSRLELIDEYGFVASTASIQLDFKRVRDEFPEILGINPDDKEKIFAVIDLDIVPKKFNGILDESSGTITIVKKDEELLTLSSRSLLALLLDESETNERITTSFINKDYSAVIQTIVEARGFTTKRIQSSDVLAGEKIDAVTTLLSIDNQLPGEIISGGVSATGFVANLIGNDFVFARTLVSNDYIPKVFTFLEGDDTSEIQSAQFSDGAISNLTTNNMSIIDPGSEIFLLFPDEDILSGEYFITKSRYVADQNAESFTEFDVARELPILKTEEEEL